MNKLLKIRCMGITLFMVIALSDFPSIVMAADDTGFVLEEVVVTSRRREENLMEVPDSIAVLSGEMVVKSQIAELTDVAALLPNVDFKQDLSQASTFLYVRGLAATRNTDPAVAILVDGIQLNNPQQVRQGLFDVEQIEVLKGPQGSLYGRNAIGGAIVVTSKAPTNEFEGNVSAKRGNAGTLEFNGAVSGPLIKDKLYFRLSGNYHDSDGTIINPTVGTEADFVTKETIRLQLKYEPSDRLGMDFRYTHDDFKGGAYNYVITRHTLGAIGYTAADELAGLAPTNDANNFSGLPRSDTISVNYSTIDDVAFKIDYDLGGATLTSVTNYSETRERYGMFGEGIGSGNPGDINFLPAGFVPTGRAPGINTGLAAGFTPGATFEVGNEQTYEIDAFTQELRLTSNEDQRLRWLVGLYYMDQDREDTLPIVIDASLFDGIAGPGDVSLADETVASGGVLFPLGWIRNNNAFAAFTQFTYDFNDALELTFGLRYDREERDQLDLDDPNPATNFLKDTFEAIQPKLSLSYRLNGDSMIYGTIARGFRSGGFNATRSAFNPVYEKETLWSYELGYKGSFLDNRLSWTSAVFYEDIKNRQDFAFDFAAVLQAIYNAPKAEVYGLETEITFVPNENLRVGISGGIMDSEYKEFSEGNVFFVPQPNSFFEGNKLPSFAHWSFSLTGDYTIPLPNFPFSGDWSLSFHGDYAVKGDNYWEAHNINKEKDVHLLNGNVTLENDRLALIFGGTNLTNTRYFTNFFENYRVSGADSVGNLAPERRWGMTVRYHF
jgi:iron complex outermembrane recepter protein